MWQIDNYWFDIAIVMSVFAIGSILFGHFEEHKPKWRRLLKVGIVLGVVLLFSATDLRWIAYSIIVALALAAAWVHLVWLPRNGINGWTGRPRKHYYELLGVPEKDRPWP